jgi:hypothetical protein
MKTSIVCVAVFMLFMAIGPAHAQGCNPYAQYPSSSVYAGGIPVGPPCNAQRPSGPGARPINISPERWHAITQGAPSVHKPKRRVRP